MYTGELGLEMFKAHLKRIEDSGFMPWEDFGFSKTYIKKYFGQQAADWAIKYWDESVKKYLKRCEELPEIKEVIQKYGVQTQQKRTETKTV